MAQRITPPLYRWIDQENSGNNNVNLTDLDFDLGADEAIELIKIAWFLGGDNSTAIKGNFVITLDLEQGAVADDDMDDMDHIFGVHIMKNREITTSGASLDAQVCRCEEYFPEGTLVAQNLRAIMDWTDASTTGARVFAQLWYSIVKVGRADLRGLIARARARR